MATLRLDRRPQIWRVGERPTTKLCPKSRKKYPIRLNPRKQRVVGCVKTARGAKSVHTALKTYPATALNCHIPKKKGTILENKNAGKTWHEYCYVINRGGIPIEEEEEEND